MYLYTHNLTYMYKHIIHTNTCVHMHHNHTHTHIQGYRFQSTPLTCAYDGLYIHIHAYTHTHTYRNIDFNRRLSVAPIMDCIYIMHTYTCTRIHIQGHRFQSTPFRCSYDGLYIHMHTYTCIYTYTYMYRDIDFNRRLSVAPMMDYTYIYMHTHAYIHTHTCIGTQTSTDAFPLRL